MIGIARKKQPHENLMRGIDADGKSKIGQDTTITFGARRI
jgi:hypothetical protein